MTIRQLYQFQTVAEMQNVSKAAEKLYISQQALSKSIADFEEEVGCRLFDRTKNKIRLNSSGEKALRHVQRILKEYNRFTAAMSEYPETEKTVRICTALDLFAGFILKKIRTERPYFKISIDVQEEERAFQSLLNGTSDIAILKHGHPSGAGVEVDILAYDSLTVSVPPASPFYGRKTLRLEDLRGTMVLLFAVDEPIDQFIMRKAAEKGVSVEYQREISPSVVVPIEKQSDRLFFTSRIDLLTGNEKRRDIVLRDPDLIWPYYIASRIPRDKTVSAVMMWLRRTAGALLEF